MTRNYHRLWQRPHKPHRDSPYPDIPSEPVQLYTHQNVHLEEFDPYFVTKSHQYQPTFDPESDNNEEDEWEDCNSVDYENGQNCESVTYESDHNDYNEHSDGDYYHDDERHDQQFEPNYNHHEEDFDGQPRQHDYDDDGYEFYSEDSEALGHHFKKLDLGNGIIELSHAANKDVFFHQEADQLYHIECLHCEYYMNRSGFEVPPPGYDYKQHGTNHDP